jgi:8-oxo-dGTP diphosphatase
MTVHTIGPSGPKLAVDVAVFLPDWRACLITRKHEPFIGAYALPGGFVEYGESCVKAAQRELLEETGLDVPENRLTYIGFYDNPKRDPRGHVVSIAYGCMLTGETALKAGDDAAAAEWVGGWYKEPTRGVLDLKPSGLAIGFDHWTIIRDALFELDWR